MTSYYYFIPTLPFLKKAGAPPLTCASFIELCRGYLRSEHWELLKLAEFPAGKFATRKTSAKTAPLIRRWKELDLGIRRELAVLRARKKKTFPPKSSPTMEVSGKPEYLHIAGELMAETDPLRAELRYGDFLWDYLEEWSFGHHFDLEFILIYFLKLQILERRFHFEGDKGRLRLSALETKV